MLDEDHSFFHDFPEWKNITHLLMRSDESFVLLTKKYNELDRRIRHLELSNSPINDDEMHLMKQNRLQLKDKLYQIIRQYKNKQELV